MGGIWVLYPGSRLANVGRLCLRLPVQLDSGECQAELEDGARPGFQQPS